MMIYFELLESKDIRPLRAGLWLQQQDSSFIVAKKDLQAGLDVAILRTCFLAYIEAAGALYGRNTFEFSNASQIADFRSKGLCKVITEQNSDENQKLEALFHFRPTPLGRLLRIRSLSLIFTRRVEDPVGGYIGTRDSILMSAWSDLLFQDRHKNGNEQWSFPALTHLKMDFEYSVLSDEGLAVCD